MKTQTISDVVEDKNIPLDEILDIFEGYGYGKEEMQDFLDSDMTDLSDAFPELKELLNGKKREPKSIDAIKDNFTPPGTKGEEEGNPQSEVRYKTPEDLMIPTMSDEDLANSIDGIERGQSDLTDAEKPIALGWIKDEMKKRKSAIDTNNNGKIEEDEMADFQKSLDDYAAKNKKGRDDIPVTTRR